MTSRVWSPESWAEIERLFGGAMDVDPGRRAAWLEAECRGDPDLRAEVLRLLRASDTAGDFLARLDARRAAALVRSAPTTPREPADDSGLGALEAIGPYRVIRLLARGGMGAVYLARDERLGRHVALKCLPPRLRADPGMRERFLAEARAASRLDHPNIGTIHDVGETPDGGPYIAMSYYEGATLAERIADGPLEISEALRLAAQIAGGLAAAHARGIIHRDVKPANVLVTADGQAKILDFGIAKTNDGQTTREGVRLGTVAYMSPEQTHGRAIDARTDVWSYGALLYEMLAGHRPFPGTDDALVIHAIRHDDPPPIESLRPEVPPGVARLIRRCLTRDPTRRFADAGSLALALKEAGEASPSIRLVRALRPVAPIAAVVLAIAAGAAWLLRADALPSGGAATLDPDLVLVLPFSPPAGDSALERLGRDLSITLSTSLDGLGEIRTVDATTVSARSSRGAVEAGSGPDLDLARELGAGRVVHGTLLWRGGRAGVDATDAGPSPSVRSDLVVYHTATGARQVRATAVADPWDVGVLTDSITWALVRGLWPSGRTPAVEPSALSTASLPALRAFLEGELATAEGRWRDAPESFERAFEFDSTFWLAYARYAESMAYRSRPVSPAVRAVVDAHLADLPLRDQAIIAARRADGLAESLARRRELVERFPDSWRAWFSLADALIHNGMFVGATVAEARTAIERAATLHPQSSTHWQHVFWMALVDRDTAVTGRALGELARLGYDSASVQEVGLDQLRFFRYLHGLAAGGDGDGQSTTAWRRATVDSLAAQLVRYTGPLNLEQLGGTVSTYGSHRGEIALDEAVLRLPTNRAAAAGALRGMAYAWAGRGAWDSAVVALERYVERVEGIEPLQHAVRLVAVGEWLGILGPDAGAEWRAALDRQSEHLSRLQRAELAWLDGIRAAARSDTAALAAARRRLVPSSGGTAGTDGESAVVDSVLISTLERSLGAFDLALGGRRAEAADSLLALEGIRAESYLFRNYGDHHPYLTAVNRLAAADWLTGSGRPAEAARLLRWHEAVQFPAHLAARADASLHGIVYFRRALAEEAAGDTDRARLHFLRAAAELDEPVDALRALVDAARERL